MTTGLEVVDARLYTPVVPHGGEHDEAVALTHRLVNFDPKTDHKSPFYKAIKREVPRLGKRLSVEPLTYQQVLDTYSGRLRARYEDAFESLQVSPYDKLDSIVAGFVKRDKVHEDNFETKAPRLIMPRNPRYGLELARFIKPIEHKFFGKKDRFGLPLFAKGKTSRQRAAVIKRKFELFPHTRISTIDAAKFDAHVSKEQLQMEHGVYLNRNQWRFFKKLLNHQLINKIRTGHGWSVSVDGKRMSGDMNTSLGNCVIVYLIIEAFIRYYKLEKHMTIFDDGDDCLLFTDDHASQFLEHLPKWFGSVGHVLKVENDTDDLDDIVFCQSKLFHGSQPPNMIRPWYKVISHCFTSHKHYHEPKYGVKVMHSIALAELSLNAAVPILQPYFVAWTNKLVQYGLANGALEESLLRRVSKKWENHVVPPITDIDREAFDRLYNVSATEQIELEKRLVSYVAEYPIHLYATGKWKV